MESEAGFSFLSLLLVIPFFIFYSYCMKLICDKASVDPGILIWIPILQIIPMATVAKINPWLLLLYLVPLVNIVFAIYHWAQVCKAINKSPWLVIMMLIPLVNIAFLPLLAFT